MDEPEVATLELAQAHTFAALLAPGLTDPTYAPPANVVGPGGKKAVKRYNVYRNNVTVSLIDALASVFPATQRLTGTEFFRAMARFHVRACPPRSPLLFEYGYDFAEFIQQYEYAQQLPYLADIARVERAWLDAYHAGDAPPFDGQALSIIEPEGLGAVVFEPHPAARIIRSNFSAVAIFAMNRGDGPVEAIDWQIPQDALITRPDQDVMVRRLPSGGATFLESLIAGKTLGDAAASAFEASAEFDLPGKIGGMIEAGVFTAIRNGDQR